MKQTILIIAIFLTIGNVNAQKKSKGSGAIKEVRGEEIKVNKSEHNAEFTNAFKIDNEYYAIGRTKRKETFFYYLFVYQYYSPSDFVIYRLDDKMNTKEKTIIPAEYFGKDVESLTIKKIGNQLGAFFYFNNKKHHRQYLFVQLLDMKTLERDGAPYKVAEVTITNKEKHSKCLFNVDVTEDFSKMYITTLKANEEKKKKEKSDANKKSHSFTYWLIDSKMKLVNTGKNIKFGNGNTSIIAHVSDNDGNVCLLGYEEVPLKVKKSKKKSEENEEENRPQSKLVMKIIKKNGDQTDLEFAKGELFYSANMKLNPHTGNVAVVGLLSSGKWGAKGIFTQQVNLGSGEYGDETVQLFSMELIKEINNLKPPIKSKVKGVKEKVEKRSKDKIKTKEPEDYIKNLVLVGDIHYNDSNEIVVVTQKYWTYEETHTASNGKTSYTYTVTYHVYSDIIPFKLNEDNEIEDYGYVFQNNVYSRGNYGRDFTSIYKDDKVYVMTTSAGGQIALNRSVSTLNSFKEEDDNQRKREHSTFMTISASEMLHIITYKKRLTFSLMSVKME